MLDMTSVALQDTKVALARINHVRHDLGTQEIERSSTSHIDDVIVGYL
jgi:hypothetical protein